jgi:hypothetical protein
MSERVKLDNILCMHWYGYIIFYIIKHFHCVSANYFCKHPTHEVRGKGWYFFYHRGRTGSHTLAFFKRRQSARTPCGMKSPSL